MRKVEPILGAISTGFSFLLFGVVFWPLIYKVPYVDDFGFATLIQEKGQLGFLHWFYFNWTGNYSSTLLLSLFAGDPFVWWYNFIPVFIAFLNVAMLSIVFRFNDFFIFNWKDSISYSLILFSILYISLPELFSAHYWHCSSFYMLSPFLLLLSFWLVFQRFKRELVRSISLTLIIIFMCGFSEILILGLGFMLLSAILFEWNSRVRRFRLIGFLIFAMLVSLINIFSPGTAQRSSVTNSTNEKVELVIGLKKSIYDFFTMEFGMLGYDHGLVLIVILVIGVLLSRKSEKFQDFVRYEDNFLLESIFVGLTGLLLFYFAVFQLIVGYSMLGRILNMIFFISIFGFSLVGVHLIQKYFGRLEMNRRFPAVLVLVFIVLFQVSILFSANTRGLIASSYRELRTFGIQNQIRFDAMMADPNAVIPLISFQPKCFQLNFHPDTLNDYNSEVYKGEMRAFFLKIHTHK